MCSGSSTRAGAPVGFLFLAALHLPHLARAERPAERDLLLDVVPPSEARNALDGLGVRATGTLQALSRHNFSSSSEGSARKVTLSMLQQNEHFGKNSEDEDVESTTSAVNEKPGEKPNEKPDEKPEYDLANPYYVTGKDAEQFLGESTPDVWTTMKAKTAYSAVDSSKLDGETEKPDGSKPLSELSAGEHIDPKLEVSSTYDKIRERLKRQEKMLTTNDFSIENYRSQGADALTKNADYHKHLAAYVQGLYRMSSGTQKLTRDTYVRHAGIATNLYNTVKDAKDYYYEGKDADKGIKKTLMSEESGYHLNAKHKKVMGDFEKDHGDLNAEGALDGASKKRPTSEEDNSDSGSSNSGKRPTSEEDNSDSGSSNSGPSKAVNSGPTHKPGYGPGAIVPYVKPTSG